MRAASLCSLVALLGHFLFRVFPQDVVSAATSPSSAIADRKRDAERA